MPPALTLLKAEPGLPYLYCRSVPTVPARSHVSNKPPFSGRFKSSQLTAFSALEGVPETRPEISILEATRETQVWHKLHGRGKVIHSGMENSVHFVEVAFDKGRKAKLLAERAGLEVLT